ncbi:MAG TPA: N-acetylmuramic acid 6-phosphate etherase [Chloroflexota bacterium]|jgi:N-acetylmuramic acid 6-phosphate etherase|nr:N-acetylmuramic acid 6-phosphate etherase [Chloroflexota bacterium]
MSTDGDLLTEDINPQTDDIDTRSTAAILRRINEEDAKVSLAVSLVLPAIEQVVERVVAAFNAGGRLIYVGAGTSGRLAALDAAECPPTYGTDPQQVQAVIAGGPAAMTSSIEGAEDDALQGARDIDALAVKDTDVVLGIAASGRTPYVVGALQRAHARGACTAALVGNPQGPIAAAAQLVIAPETGPEVVAGSTRMKAGTAQKMILTMISTTAMIRTGHTYRNLMVDMQARNSKLRQRACRIVSQATGVDQETAERTLAAADGQMKTAIVMLTAGVGAAQARDRLQQADGRVRQALQNGQP